MKWCTFVLMLGLPCTWGLLGGVGRRQYFWDIRPSSYVVTPTWNCSGSLIHIQWVITSAHCFFYRPRLLENVQVLIVTAAVYYVGIRGERRGAPGTVYRSIEKIIYQEVQNVPNGRGREAALVKLRHKVSNSGMTNQHYLVSYLVRGPFPLENRFTGVICNNAGMGFDVLPTFPINKRLRLFAPTGTSCRQFLSVLSSPLYYKELCVKRRPGRGICNGDWGGPLLCKDDLVTVALLWRPVHKNGSFVRPYHCARGDVIETYVYTGAVLRFVRYYIPDLQVQVYMHYLIHGQKRTAAGKQCSANPIVIVFIIYFIRCI